jgi:hypothetical protein
MFKKILMYAGAFFLASLVIKNRGRIGSIVDNVTGGGKQQAPQPSNDNNVEEKEDKKDGLFSSILGK